MTLYSHFAAAYGKVETLEWIFQGVDKTELYATWRDSQGNTPVHDAAVNGKVECLKVFVK